MSSLLAGVTNAELGVAATALGALLGAGAALLPDLDADGASAYRSAGPVTWAVGETFQAAARVAFRRTRLEHDPGGDGEHRGLVHTPVFAAVIGLLIALGALISPWVTAVVMVLVIAPGIGALCRSGPKWTRSLLIEPWVLLLTVPVWLHKKSRKSMAGSIRKSLRKNQDVPPMLAALLITGLLWHFNAIADLGWYAGLSIAIGMIVHSVGDSATRSGIPWLWPLLRACEKCETKEQRGDCPGSRWRRSHVLPEKLRWRVGSPVGKVVERSIEVACLAGVGLLLLPDVVVLMEATA